MHSSGESISLDNISYDIIYTLCIALLTSSGLAVRQSRRNICVAIETCHFFCKVCHTFEILTEGRDCQHICLFIITKLQLLEDRKHNIRRNVCSKQLVHLLRLKRKLDFLDRIWIYIYHTVNNLTTAKFLDQLAGTVDCLFCQVWIKSLYEFCGCIGSKTDPLCCETDICTVKAGCLEQQCLDVIRNHGIFATHDTGDTDFLLAVTDHQNILVHLTFLTVQCHKCIAVICTFYNDLPACDRIQIIRVHWLAVLFHNIVCDINQIVDGTDSLRSQSLTHPFRGRTDLQICNNSGCITWAQIRCLYIYRNIIIYIAAAALYFDLRLMEFLVKGCSSLSRHTDHRETIHTVRCDLILYNGIMQTECCDCIIARFHT